MILKGSFSIFRYKIYKVGKRWATI
ncbi:KxYKxGKxW signal peptide domain-containing protein [Lactococcus petauri]